MQTILYNGRFFRPATSQSREPEFAECLVIDDKSGKIKHIGSTEDAIVREAKAADAKLHDMHGRIVVPGFIDAHMHLFMTGESLNKLDISTCKDLEEIREAIRKHARENPSLLRILCRGWQQTSTGGAALASTLDDLDPRPIYINAEDLHSSWLNTAALNEVGVADMEDPPGGSIHRDEHGVPTGLLSETASFRIVWPYLSGILSAEQRIGYIKDAFDAYISSGYTGIVELAMNEADWNSLQLFRSRQPNGTLPISLAAHWIIMPRDTPEETMEQVEQAIEYHKRFNATNSPDFRIAGIKIICDGVVDSCTAAMHEPYSHNNKNDMPMWSREQLVPVLKRADGAGLQCALHAIGDATITLAIDSLEEVGNPAGRHRIEHLETCRPEDAKRLGPLGITASVQPVHCDPEIVGHWKKLLGPNRCQHIFPYAALAKGGAVLAIGTDSPTAPYNPLENLYVATTRRSARTPAREDQTTPQFAISLVAAMAAATQGAAYCCFADGRTGTLEEGKEANLAVIDMKWDAHKLLEARVKETWYLGDRIYEAE